MSKKLNLSRAPWWGGQFERLIRVIKIAMHKVIVGGVLTCYELSEVLLDVETQINWQPLSYVEDDVELPILPPHSCSSKQASYHSRNHGKSQIGTSANGPSS